MGKTVPGKDHVPLIQQILLKDTHAHVISAIQETTVKLVGRLKYFDKDMKDLSYNNI